MTKTVNHENEWVSFQIHIANFKTVQKKEVREKNGKKDEREKENGKKREKEGQRGPKQIKTISFGTK